MGEDLELQKNVISLKEETDDGFIVKYEVLSPYNTENYSDEKRKEIMSSISDIDKMTAELEDEITEYNVDIERFTNKADGIDYTVAVACGVLCELLDSFVVGEFDYEKSLEKSKESVNNFVEQKAEKLRSKEARKKAAERGEKLSSEETRQLKEKVSQGLDNTNRVKNSDAENGTSKALQRAIKKLEETYKIPSDNLFTGADIGVDATTHHLDDLAHHPTVLGLVAAVAGTLFRIGIFSNKAGKWAIKFANVDKKEMLQMWIPVIVSGILTWLLFVVKSKYKDEIDSRLPKPIQKLIVALAQVPAAITVLTIANNWLGHLASDMAGSSTSSRMGRDGMGIPGLFVSMFKEISSIPSIESYSIAIRSK